MIIWLLMIGGPIAFGIICAFFVKRPLLGGLLSAAIPWLTLLLVLLYNEYFVPYQGGGFSFWPIIQMIWGTVMAILGAATYALTRVLTKRAKPLSSS